jgi:hypothetical protein
MDLEIDESVTSYSQPRVIRYTSRLRYINLTGCAIGYVV